MNLKKKKHALTDDVSHNDCDIDEENDIIWCSPRATVSHVKLKFVLFVGFFVSVFLGCELSHIRVCGVLKFWLAINEPNLFFVCVFF